VVIHHSEARIKKYYKILKLENLILIVFNLVIIAEDWSKISEDAKNLIRKMLTKEPKDRLSA
jgi:serine/threonine protein kinase